MRFGSTLLQKMNKLATFQSLLKTPEKKLTIIDFQAQWCGPCRMMKPHWEQLQSKYSQIKFYEVDVDENPEIAKECDVSAMPTYILLKNGKVVDKLVGANPHLLREKITTWHD